MKTTLIDTIYTDPGHGWVKVPLTRLSKLGIIDKITTYSYIRNDHAYLEEDCDFSTYISALKAVGITPKFKEVHTNKSSKIRSYRHYSPSLATELIRITKEFNL